MWSCEATVQLAWSDVDHAGGVGDLIVPVLSGDFPLYEVRVTRFQWTSPVLFQYFVLALTFLWGCHDIGFISKEPFLGRSLGHLIVKFNV